MVDAIGAIQDSYELYKENWKKIITAFAVMFLFALVFGAINFGLSLPGQFGICEAKNALIVLIFCISPYILQQVLGFLNGLINFTVTMAVIKPLDEVVSKKTVSDWTKHFFPQLFNTVKVMVMRGLVTLVIFAPFIISLIGYIPAIVALKGKMDPGVLVGGGFLLIMILLIFTAIVWSIVMFLLTFLEIEIVIGGSGVFKAMSKSFSLVKDNVVDVFVFSFLWFLIRFAMGFVTLALMCTVCLIPVAMVIPSLILEPIELMSKVVLWRKLNKSG